jgi:mRNA-degrading endonuclease RelE of RelBE toxin-antitoxin system
VTEGRWSVKLTGAVRRALDQGLPEQVAWAAYAFVADRLPVDPYRVGGELQSPYEGLRSAHLGTYRGVYRIDEDAHTATVLAIRLRSDVYGIR